MDAGKETGMYKTANQIVEDVMEEYFDMPSKPEMKTVADCICQRLAQEGILKKMSNLQSNEILFAIKKEREVELIQLCERYMYFLKERREDGSLIFEGKAGEKNATQKMTIGVVIYEKKELLNDLTKWIWTNGTVEEDALAELQS